MSKADRFSEAVGEGRFLEHLGKDRESAATLPRTHGLSEGTLDGVIRRVKNSAVIPLERIDPDPEQPRKHFDQDELNQLAESLKTEGQLQPVRVMKCPDQPGRFILLMGERRYRAAKLAGMESLEAIVDKKRLTDDEKLQIQYIENALRQDLNAIEEARTFETLLASRQCGVRQLAEILHIEASTISRARKLLELPEDIQQHVIQGKLPPAPAYEIARIEDQPQQRKQLKAYLNGEVTATDIAALNGRARGKTKANRNGASNRAKKANIDGMTISVSSKRRRTGLEMAAALRQFAESLEGDGRSRRAAA